MLIKSTVSVDILLSTFNGEKYLSDQIDSIINQTHSNWKLLIRDDGSEDSTQEIIQRYCIKHPDKIRLLKDKHENLGFTNSFIRLMQYTTAEYIMFCDQDDFWLPSKIEKQLKCIIEEEYKDGNNIKPRLVCSDLSICNKDMTIIVTSFMNYINYKPQLGQQINLLAPNIHGCACIFNRLLMEQCLKIQNPLHHDDGFAIVCAVIGKISFIHEPLVLHRIHNSNVAGFAEITNKKKLVYLKILAKYFFNNKGYRIFLYKERLTNITQLLGSINQMYPNKMHKKFAFFIGIENSNYFKRKYYNIFHPYIHYQNCFDRLINIFCF